MTDTTNALVIAGSITWFEIPAREIDMATRFYEGALDTHLRRGRAPRRPRPRPA